MKTTVKYILAAAAATLGLADAFGRSPVSLNGSWEFRFEAGKPLEAVADATFVSTDTIAVPGCWDVLPKWYLKRGTGLYRRTFRLDEPASNAWLVVDGMGLRGDFRIDGRALGVYPYPYLRLEIPVGPLAAGDHEIFAALDNRFDWDSMKLARPYYDFYFYGGFYHGVSLVFDNRKLRVRTRDYATGAVEIEVVGFAESDFDATLVFDGRSKVEASFRNSRASVSVPDFKLWSPNAPNLHTVALDGVSARFGIRTIEARGRKLFLNGEEIFLKGVNRHESDASLGAATVESQMLVDIQHVKELGANFIRGAHYPQSQRFLDLCDECGLMVWEESLGWGNGQNYTAIDGVDECADEGFIAAQIFQTREMVRASFNHPSVVIFGFLNEPGGYSETTKALVDALVSVVKEEDSGRLVTFACNRWKNDISNESTDIIAFNSYPGTIPCCPGEPDDLKGKVADSATQGFNTIVARFRERYPDKTIIVSESGCGGLYGLHDPAAGWMSEEFQDEYLGDILETLFSNSDVAGYAIWQLNDTRTYHRNSRNQPAKQLAGFSIAGLYDVQRRAKKAVETVRRHFMRQPSPR